MTHHNSRNKAPLLLCPNNKHYCSRSNCCVGSKIKERTQEHTLVPTRYVIVEKYFERALIVVWCVAEIRELATSQYGLAAGDPSMRSMLRWEILLLSWAIRLI